MQINQYITTKITKVKQNFDFFQISKTIFKTTSPKVGENDFLIFYTCTYVYTYIEFVLIEIFSENSYQIRILIADKI